MKRGCSYLRRPHRGITRSSTGSSSTWRPQADEPLNCTEHTSLHPVFTGFEEWPWPDLEGGGAEPSVSLPNIRVAPLRHISRFFCVTNFWLGLSLSSINMLSWDVAQRPRMGKGSRQVVFWLGSSLAATHTIACPMEHDRIKTSGGKCRTQMSSRTLCLG